MTDVPRHSDQADALLAKVADALGVPIQAFYEDAPGEAGELLTLMRLWSAIRTQEGRRRVLTVARQEFEQSVRAGAT